MMIDHLDHNGYWVVLVYAIALGALVLAAAFTAARTRNRKKHLDKNRDAES